MKAPGAADHAVGVVAVEIGDVVDAGEAAAGHQRQPVDDDALRDQPRRARRSTGAPWLLGPSPEMSMTRFWPLKAAFGEQIGAEFERAGDRGAPRAVGRLRRSLRRHAAAASARVAITVHGTMTCCEDDPGPFEIGDGDAAVDAVGDRLQHLLVGQRRGVALALDVEFRRRHRQRHIDGQHQFDVDRLGRTGPATHRPRTTPADRQAEASSWRDDTRFARLAKRATLHEFAKLGDGPARLACAGSHSNSRSLAAIIAPAVMRKTGDRDGPVGTAAVAGRREHDHREQRRGVGQRRPAP